MDVFVQRSQKAQEDVQGAVPPLQSVNLLPTNDTLDGSPKAELEKTLSHIPAMASQNTMPTDQLHVPTNRTKPVSSISTAWSRGGLAVCVWGPLLLFSFKYGEIVEFTHAFA